MRTLLFLEGKATADGELLPGDILDAHDWRRFLLAKDMERDYQGPVWVPFSLWGACDGASGDPLRKIAHTLIYSAGAEELWAAIERTYERPNSVAAGLPLELCGVFEHWARVNKSTPSDHRKQMLRLKANCLALATEVERINNLAHLLTGDMLDFMRLYTDEERGAIYRNVRLHNLRLRKRAEEEVEAHKLGYGLGSMPGRVTQSDWDAYNRPQNEPQLPESPINHSVASSEAHETWGLLTGDEAEWPGIFPPLPDLFRRLAAHFDEEAGNPALQRPAFANAKRNFVARQLCLHFRNSCGFASPSIISRVVSMFFDQGISDDEVSQMIQQMPGGNVPQPLPGLFD